MLRCGSDLLGLRRGKLDPAYRESPCRNPLLTERLHIDAVAFDLEDTPRPDPARCTWRTSTVVDDLNSEAFLRCTDQAGDSQVG